MSNQPSDSAYKQAGIKLNVRRANRCFNNNGVNSDIVDKLNKYDEQLLTLKKNKAPKVLPKPVKKDHSDEEFSKLRESYLQSLKEYNSYRSVDYDMAYTAYKVVKKCRNLLQMMEKNVEKPLKSRDKKIEDIKAKFATSKADNHCDVSYQDVIGAHKYETAAEIEKLVDDLSLKYGPQLVLFQERDQLRKQKVRFSEGTRAVVTDFIQEVVKDFVEVAGKECKRDKKKNISLKHCSTDVLSTSPFFAIYRDSPTVKALECYLKRYEEYSKDKKEFAAKQKLSRGNVKVEKAETEEGEKQKAKPLFPSFGDCEVNSQHAIFDGKKYMWPGLDTPKDPSEDVHNTYIKTLFKDVKSTNKGLAQLSMCESVRGFMSNLIVDFFKKVSASITNWHECSDTFKITLRVPTLIFIIKNMFLSFDEDGEACIHQKVKKVLEDAQKIPQIIKEVKKTRKLEKEKDTEN